MPVQWFSSTMGEVLPYMRSELSLERSTAFLALACRIHWKATLHKISSHWLVRRLSGRRLVKAISFRNVVFSVNPFLVDPKGNALFFFATISYYQCAGLTLAVWQISCFFVSAGFPKTLKTSLGKRGCMQKKPYFINGLHPCGSVRKCDPLQQCTREAPIMSKRIFLRCEVPSTLFAPKRRTVLFLGCPCLIEVGKRAFILAISWP